MSTKGKLLPGVVLGLMALAGAETASAAGTSLSVVFDAPIIACRADGTGADFDAGWTVTSTGSADSASMTGQFDGGAIFPLPTIASGNVTTGGGWTFAGRMKTSDGSYNQFLANGDHTFTVCATQSGAGGNANKTTCATLSVPVHCELPDNPCANVASEVSVPGNKNLCGENLEQNVIIHAKGDFGDSPTLTIKWPDGSEHSESIFHAGESCNFQANWAARGENNGGEGAYLFTVSGNNHTKTVSEDFECKLPKNNN